MVFILFFLSKIQIVGEIHAGDSFGELALIHETHRRASVICKEQSEFLRLDKDDFNQVQKCLQRRLLFFNFYSMYHAITLNPIILESVKETTATRVLLTYESYCISFRYSKPLLLFDIVIRCLHWPRLQFVTASGFICQAFFQKCKGPTVIHT